ncbi:DUF4272 domain-containing protein [Gallaecimonas mangrovi]|uniref:DUF4272 domain-containing protein n=1 Tax=Gallaecimonas mangrovi TaxID=2291597 RepID=UPI000E20AA8F|nr:DUF4272 domain-containing protein [Gallaecimonas mangrovi]
MEDVVSQEALDRRSRSIALLTARHIPTIAHLPVIDDSSQALTRSTQEVALRAMALLMVAVKGEGLEQDILDDVIGQYQLQGAFTEAERRFIENPAPSEYDKTQFVWRYEAAWVLLWALGYVDNLGEPTDICDVPAAVTFMQARSREQFIDDAKLRALPQLLDENDLIYRYHWAVVDARIKGEASPQEVNGSVVMERHYAFNWLTGYLRQDWDHISTDT